MNATRKDRLVELITNHPGLTSTELAKLCKMVPDQCASVLNDLAKNDKRVGRQYGPDMRAKAILDDPVRYAEARLLDKLPRGKAWRFYPLGTQEGLPTIDPNNLL